MAAIKFNSNYVNTILSPGINSIILRTELGGNSNLINSFSFAGGKSTYSFGLYQFDVGNNSLAVSFLKSIGFSATQISMLSQNGGLSSSQLSILNAQLNKSLQNSLNQKALQVLNNTQTSVLITQLQNSLNVVALNNPDIAKQIIQSPELQLRIIDYANQFNLSPSTAAGTMTGWLSGLPAKTILTGVMVQDFVMNTAYARNNPVSEGNRELALNTEIKNLALPTVEFITAGSLAGSVVLENTSLTGAKTFRLLAPNETLTNGAVSGSGNVSFNSNGNTFVVRDGSVISSLVATANTKALQLTSINQPNLQLQNQGNSMLDNAIGVSDSIMLKDLYSPSTAPKNNPIERIKTTDVLPMYNADLERFIQAMAGFAPPSSAQTSWADAPVIGQVSTSGQGLLAVAH